MGDSQSWLGCDLKQTVENRRIQFVHEFFCGTDTKPTDPSLCGQIITCFYSILLFQTKLFSYVDTWQYCVWALEVFVHFGLCGRSLHVTDR
jgi:hypothetical protein